MATAQDLLNQVCDSCKKDYDAAFTANPRLSEVIAGDVFVDTCCFVRDEIRFLNGGRLIFVPQKERKTYCSTYAVVCRRITVVGGKAPGTLNPCGSDDPGQEYAGNNVITWVDRLHAAGAGGAPNPAHAGSGESFDRNDWSSNGNSSDKHGRNGGAGAKGAKGATGGNGANAPGQIVVAALEIVFDPGAHLTIDWDGQTGGKGGEGQRGGDGGNGMGGRDGNTESSWGSESCERQTGNGGRGGDGGDGGEGGDGGSGGRGGKIFVLSTLANITGTTGFVGGGVTYVYDGGTGGDGAVGGRGGAPGAGGHAGAKGSACDSADDGDTGNEGFPPAGLVDAISGHTGAHGGSGEFKPLEIVSHACSDPIPLPVVLASVAPNNLVRGFASAATVDASVLGSNLAQVTAIGCSLSGVTVTFRSGLGAVQTDTQRDVTFTLTGASGIGAGNLSLSRVFGPAQNAANAITVTRFELTGVAPNTGARNNIVSVTLTGTGFDPFAAAHTVSVSGNGVTVAPASVVVVDTTHVQCQFDIGNLATLSARDVTLTIAGKSHTLPGAFTVTA